MEYASIIIPFAGGLGMFIYGMQIMAGGLENAAGSRMKKLLEVLTRNKFMGVLLGALITAVIQSSSATTVMVVGFVNAGIMNLGQAMGVIMGANIGTTVTGWIVSSGEWAQFLKPESIAPIAIMAGVVIMLMAKKQSSKEVASIIIGFGLLFIGISTMSDAVYPLRDSETFRQVFISLGSNPLLGILAGAAVTAIIQSSSASVGILQSLAASGLVPFNAALYIIMGQNIGTCVTAMLSSIGARKNAKTAALMHLLFNLIGTLIFGVIVIILFRVINPSLGQGTISQTQISTVHTIFNITTTVLLFPVSNLIVRLAKKISRVDEEERKDKTVQLDDRILETPSIAVQSTVTEVVRMGHVVTEALRGVPEAILQHDEERIEDVKEIETKVDKMSAGITDYIVKISGLSINETENETTASLLQIVSDMERICDHCENLVEYAEQLNRKKVTMSDLAQGELLEMMKLTIGSYENALDAMEHNDKDAALKAIEKETIVDEMEISLRKKHIKRLKSNECHTEAGIVFLDTINSLERITDHSRNIAEEVIKGVAS